MDKNTCKDCQHFIQHYGLDDHELFQVYCGHCRLSRPYHKKPDKPACENFVPGVPDADRFVTKEYLSKTLLAYFLSIELLPEIKEAPTDDFTSPLSK